MVHLIGALVILTIFGQHLVYGDDPDPRQDFCVADGEIDSSIYLDDILCKDPSNVTPKDFRSSKMRSPGDINTNLRFAVTLADVKSFRALNTQGLSFARFDYAPGALVPPHIHPHASEIVFVEKGLLYVGFTDTKNILYADTIGPGDLFVFPRNTVHFILNKSNKTSLSYSSFNSQSPGTSLIPTTFLNTTPPIANGVLEKSLKLAKDHVEELNKVIGNIG